MSRKMTVVWCAAAVVVLALACGMHDARGGFGVGPDDIEADARKSQSVPENWLSAGQTDAGAAAYLFFPEDWREQADPNRNTPIFAIYLKSGLIRESWRFRFGGTGPAGELGIQRVLWKGQQFFFSLNAEGVSRAVWQGGTGQEERALDPAKPFVLIVPNEERVTFYDENGRPIEPGVFVG